MPPVSSEPQPQHQHRDDRQQQCQSPGNQLQDPLNRGGDVSNRDPDRDVPYVQEIAPVLDEVVDIAREQLDDPMSVEIETWQDGEYQIRITHGQGKPGRFRYNHEMVIQYHSRREDIEAFYARIDREGDNSEVLIEETLGQITDPLQQKRG